ncbi:MAG: YbjN domain-containing protein [Actinomycetaceae bacterium]|nr:YbjN domain-containing protein [Actinomycetaceae bacterium]
MGLLDLFTSSDQPVDTIRPLTRERLIDIFGRMGWKYHINELDHMGARWGSAYYFFILCGKEKEILQIAGRMREEIPQDRYDELLDIIEEWHRTTLGPKVYHSLNDDAQIHVHCEHTIDYEYGATDAQLIHHIRTTLAYSAQFWDTVYERLGIAKIEG